MATINGENTAPQQGYGAATILRPDLSPLRILQQGDALRNRRAQIEAAAKAKKDAEAAKMIRDNLDYNLGADPYHGEAIRTQLNAQALPRLMKIAADPTLDETAKSFAYAGIKQEQNQAAAMATANLPIYNGALTHAYANKQYYDPNKVALNLRDLTAGKLPSDVDAPAIAQQALDNSLNEQGITDEVVKTHFPDQTFKVEHAGGYGGLHTSTQVKSNGLYKLDKNLDRIKNADGSYAIDIPAAKVAQLDQGYFKTVIDRDAAKYQARIDAGEALPTLDRAGLIRTRLAQGYATYNNQHGEGRNAQARAAASGGKPKVVVNANTNTQLGGTVPIMDNGQALNYPTTAVFQAPTKTKLTTGQTEGYGYDGALHSTYIRSIPGKDDEVVSHNREPQNVQYGGGHTALVTPSGKLVRPPHGEQLTGKALTDWMRSQREKDPRLTVETIVEGIPRKGKNELGDRQGIADDLQKQYDDLPMREKRKKPRPTHEQLLKEADDIVAKQNARYQYIYSDKHPLSEKRAIDANAPGAYNSPEKAAELARIRQEADEASRPRPTPGGSVYRKPAPTTPTTSTPSRGGSIYKIK